MKRCESAKQRGLFALKPSQNKDANFKCLRLALKLLQRWPQLWPNARSKSLQPSAPRRPLSVTSSSAGEDRLRSPSARDRPSLAQRSFGLRPAQPQLSRGLLSTKEPAASRRAPEQSFKPNRRSCAYKQGTYLQLLALKSLQPWPQLWPNARSQPSALAGLCKPRKQNSSGAKAGCEAQARATVKLWAQASAAATFTRQTLLRLNLLQLQRSTSAGD